jgi:DNA-binding response OmpR family regulator
MATSAPSHGQHGHDAANRAARARKADRRWSTPLGLALLVADPDVSQRGRLLSALTASGVRCTWCVDGAETLVRYGQLTPDAILMSAVLDTVDAPTVVRTIRARGTLPILLGIGPGDSDSAGPVLVAGASTAVARPYDPGEVVRRLEAMVPQMAWHGRLTYGPLELDPRSFTVRLNGQELQDVPLKEFELLRLLMLNADCVVTSEQIRHALWGDLPHAPSSNAIVVHVARLRARLGGQAVVRTVRGRGYRLTDPVDEAEPARGVGRPFRSSRPLLHGD